MNLFRRISIFLTIIILGLWLNNSSLFADTSANETRIIAHRGVHQTYAGTDLDRQACTASPVHPVSHEFIENTIPSMRAAFGYGADVVELDVHLTKDNIFAVFHDWTLDCRTNGKGVTHEQSWAMVKNLDIGYNYSVDGKTFPLRGKAIGLMPNLTDILAEDFPGQLLINFKSNRATEGHEMAKRLTEEPYSVKIWGIYGGARPTKIATENSDITGFTTSGFKTCMIDYLLFSWSGYVPESCRNTVVAIPQNYSALVWGFPHRFTQRMRNHGTKVILIGPYDGSAHTRGVDTPEMLAKVPSNFDGYIWTNKIEVVGPLVERP